MTPLDLAGAGQLIVYRYLGCASRVTGSDRAEGRMRLRRDLRGAAGGPLAAPLGVMMQDCAGIVIDPISVAAPTQIDVHLLDAAAGVEALRIEGAVLRHGRTSVFTQARISDAASPERVVALGSIHWSVLGPRAPGFRYTDPGNGVPDSPSLPPLYTAFGAHARPGGGFAIAQLEPGISASGGRLDAPEGILHGGAIQVLAESAATQAAGNGSLRIVDFATTLLTAGRVGPFLATAEVVARSADEVACLASVRDAGAGDRLLATSFARFRASAR